MKHFYLLILSSLLFCSAFAGVVRTLNVNRGNLYAANSWFPVGLPSDGDILIVPKGDTLVVAKELDLVQLSVNNISLIIEGTLDLVNGKLTLDAASTIYLSSNTATILTEQGAADKISIGASEKYNGKSGSIVGPAIADVTTSSSKTTSISTTAFETPTTSTISTYNAIIIASTASATLPVKFLSFSVSKASTGVSVQWSTAQEINAEIFKVERSEDSRIWKTIGAVSAVGNSSITQNYSFTDKTLLNSVAYYRIKEVDIDGNTTYTDVKSVTNYTNLASTTNNVTIIPSGSNIVVNFSKPVTGTVMVRLISFGGQVLAQQAYNQPAQQISFSKTYVNKGNYIVSVSNNSDLNVSKQIAL